MCYYLLWLMALSALFGGNDGYRLQFDRHERLGPNKRVYINNINYPKRYISGLSYRWTLYSDRPIRLTCEHLNVPYTPRCQRNRLILQDGNGHLRYYCGGDHSFSFATVTNELTVTFDSSPYSDGGAFLCIAVRVESQAMPPCECGKKNPARIYGGEETGINEFPMMAALVSKGEGILLCGGTIINKRQVLTAAHCVIGRSRSETAILVGDHNIKTGKDTSAARIHTIHSFRYHRGYDPRTADYDIAIVTVQDAIVFNDRVSAICLPFQRAHDTFIGNSVQAIGWGATGAAKGPSDVLRKATLGVITKYECRRFFQSLSERQMCTQEPGKDSCSFDSGGPLVWHSYTTGRLILVGLVSAGGPCGTGEAAVNTRIGPLLRWILDNTPESINYCRVE